MRVRIVFTLKNKGAMVPFHHQQLIYDLVNQLIPNFSTEYNHVYSFSGLKGQTQVSQKGLHFFSNKITWVVSTLSPIFIKKLIESIFQQNELQIGELLLSPDYVEKEIFPEPTNTTQFLCISPIVLVSPIKNSFYAKHFVSPSIDLFSDLLYQSTLSRIEESGLYSEAEIDEFYKFQFVPDQTYLEKIKNNDKKFARIYVLQDEDQKLEIRGYTLPFTLYAHPKVQNFVINCGLGSYNHKGYGMLDLADHSKTEREILPHWEMATVSN
jgi:CRISPR-associated endoribonuclease Cas6